MNDEVMWNTEESHIRWATVFILLVELAGYSSQTKDIYVMLLS